VVSGDARHPWWLPAGARLAAGVVLALGFTWRVRRLRQDAAERALAGDERCIFAFWHSRLLPLVFLHRRRGIAVLVSRHRDGEWIARVIQHLGFHTARGSSTRGGEAGVRELLEWAERGHRLAITPDGPRGPRERVKPGLVVLAQRTGWPVVPAAASGMPSWKLNSWDGFRIPKPFARVVVGFGDPVRVPRALEEVEIEQWQLRLEAAISEVTREVQAASGEVPA
jgi:lysophospholipid acyltransferase (LPLAT)-like uncharacterized protein